MFDTDRAGHTVRRVDVATRRVTTLAGRSTSGSADGVGTSARFFNPWGIDVTPDGAIAYVAESTADRIRQIDVASGTVTTLAGAYNVHGFADGVGTDALFYARRQVAFA